MTPQETLHRANRAQALMDDPILKGAIEVMEREVMEAWMVCPVRDFEGREYLWRMAVTTRKFADLLRGTIESGKLAADQLRREKESLAARALNVIRR